MRHASQASTLRDTAVALLVTLAIQVYVSLTSTSTAVLAPEIARDVGLPPRLVGVFVGLVYVGSMVSSLAAGQFVARYGAIRVSQVAVLICIAGISIVASAHAATVLLLALAALVIGLGYGPITPASSHVLARTTPPSRMALTFSIKQTGVPAGAAIAGAILPVLAQSIGWRTAFIAIAIVGIVVALLAEPPRASLDGELDPAAAPFSPRSLVAPLGRVARHARLRELAITGFVYAAIQMCLMSFLVVYLTESLGQSLVAAGLALTTANIGGIAGRIVWGAVADRIGAPRLMLGVLGLGAAASAYLVALLEPGSSTAAILAVCGMFGATAIGWNGVQLSEVARQAPPGEAGVMTGASGFITFGGVVLGPPTFALLATVFGSYRVGFAVFGTLALVCGVALLRPGN